MDAVFATTLSVDFKINRLVDKRLVCSHYDLIMELDLDPDYSPTEQTKRLTYIKHWVENILNGSIAFNVHTQLHTDILGQLENNIMFCPDEPNDHLIMMLVMAKINAIGSDVITVVHASISSDTNQGFSYSLGGDPLEFLVESKDWMGERRYFDQPWWNRPDGGMMDLPCGDDEDPENKPDILVELDPKVVKVEKNIIQSDSDSEKQSAEIIKLNFKPRLVVDNDEN